MSASEVTSAPEVKVVAAAGDAALGSAISVILPWILNQKIGLTPPTEVKQGRDHPPHLSRRLLYAAGASGGGVVTEDGSVKSALTKPEIAPASPSAP